MLDLQISIKIKIFYTWIYKYRSYYYF